MKKILLLSALALLVGCGPSEEKQAWIKANDGLEDKYTCEDGIKMHSFWYGERLRKVPVKNRWFTPVTCDMPKGPSLYKKYFDKVGA